jgi:trehalose 6-phosphate phosphatase
VLVDFDGSIATIVDDPADARVLPAARAVLAALTGRLRLVGVVSGRPVEFLARAINLPALTLVGQYGLERLEEGRVVVDPRAEAFLPAIAAAVTEIEAALPGLLVERKGGVAVTVHWRTAPDRERQAIEATDAAARRHGLAVYPTRMARELRPPVPVDKGTAVESLLTDLTTACFAGDDRGDLGAFDALDRLVTEARLEHAARIAVRSAEVPPELLARSDLSVDGPTGLVAVLDALAEAIPD